MPRRMSLPHRAEAHPLELAVLNLQPFAEPRYSHKRVPFVLTTSFPIPYAQICSIQDNKFRDHIVLRL